MIPLNLLIVTLLGCKEDADVPSTTAFDVGWWENDTANPYPESDIDTNTDNNNAENIAPDLIDADQINGEDLYLTKCSSCHGAIGEGGEGPPLIVNVPLLNNDQLYVVICDGLEGMPGGLLDSILDIADVMAFIRSWEE
jgi:mono/diheme cytochrome c family protein